MSSVTHDQPAPRPAPVRRSASIQTYLIVFAALIILLFLSVGLAYRPVEENSPCATC